MYIIEKLNQQLSELKQKIDLLYDENRSLKKQIQDLEDQNDQLRYNNENMLLNIDKVLHLGSNNDNMEQQ